MRSAATERANTGMACSNCTKTRRAKRAASRFARPGIALGSTSASGTRASAAAATAGTDA